MPKQSRVFMQLIVCRLGEIASSPGERLLAMTESIGGYDDRNYYIFKTE